MEMISTGAQNLFNLSCQGLQDGREGQGEARIISLCPQEKRPTPLHSATLSLEANFNSIQRSLRGISLSNN